MKSHQDENAGIRFVFICISTFFTTRTNLNQNKLKQIRSSEFVFLFSPKPSQYVTFSFAVLLQEKQIGQQEQ